MPADRADRPERDTFLDRLWVLLVAGIPTGVLVVGVGSRVAMLLLRVTSPEHVKGIVSDDGFVIGRVTLAGTYNLLLLGAAIGVIGAALYTWVAPWLVGPVWFRRATVAASCGAVVGALIVHADGVDFTLLEPRWLAVALFVALPAVFGWVIGAMVDRARSNVHHGRGLQRWLPPVALLTCFPLLLVVLAPITLVLAAWSWLRVHVAVEEAVDVVPVAILVRAAWLSVAATGLAGLLGDIGEVALG